MQCNRSHVDAKKGISSFSISGGKFEGLILIGLLATVAFDLVMYTDIAITGVPLDITVVLGQLTIGEHPYADAVGRFIHIGVGIGLSLLFGYVVLPISRKIVKLPTWIYGISFGVVELIIGGWFGLLPAIGAGVAGLNIAPEIPLMTLFRHIAFGLVLGVLVRRWKN